MSSQFDPNIHAHRLDSEVNELQVIMRRLNQKIQRDDLVQSTTDGLRRQFQVDRVLLYYFYAKWEGQVTFESLSQENFSILGSKGPDQCFNEEYAQMYFEGRVRAIADIEVEPIAPCHRDYLRYLQVRANLVVPILTTQGLWGLLVAHHCQGARSWTDLEVEQIKAAALALATAPSISERAI